MPALRLTPFTTQFKSSAIALIACLAMASCSTGMDPNNLPKPLNDNNIISVTLPGVAVNSDTKLAWFSEIVLIRSENVQPSLEIVAYIQEAIQAYLTDRGAQFVDNPKDADYLVGAAFVADNTLSKEEMAERFRLYPTLLSHRNYETGTLVAGLLPPGGGDARWRGAIQVYTKSVPDEVARQRVRTNVALLLDNIPRN